jgi:prefoldin subunit 4
LEEIKEELKSKKVILQNMDDALNDISAAELESDDPSEGVRIHEGETFVKFDYENATEWIEEKKKTAQEEVSSMNASITGIREEMNQLKTALYARFGKDNINLEADD